MSHVIAFQEASSESEADWHNANPSGAGILRINVTLQQFDEFYRTYHVKKGDTMYLDPEDRILVW